MTKKDQAERINRKFKRAIEGMRRTVGDFGELAMKHFTVFDVLHKLYEKGHADGLRDGAPNRKRGGKNG